MCGGFNVKEKIKAIDDKRILLQNWRRLRMTCKNLNDLFAHIQKDISDTLEHEVAEEVKETMSEAVQTTNKCV